MIGQTLPIGKCPSVHPTRCGRPLVAYAFKSRTADGVKLEDPVSPKNVLLVFFDKLLGVLGTVLFDVALKNLTPNLAHDGVYLLGVRRYAADRLVFGSDLFPLCVQQRRAIFIAYDVEDFLMISVLLKSNLVKLLSFFDRDIKVFVSSLVVGIYEGSETFNNVLV